MKGEYLQLASRPLRTTRVARLKGYASAFASARGHASPLPARAIRKMDPPPDGWQLGDVHWEPAPWAGFARCSHR